MEKNRAKKLALGLPLATALLLALILALKVPHSDTGDHRPVEKNSDGKNEADSHATQTSQVHDTKNEKAEPRNGGEQKRDSGGFGVVNPPMPGAKIRRETVFVRYWENPDGASSKEIKFPRTDGARAEVIATLMAEQDAESAADGIASALGGLSIRWNKEGTWDPTLDQGLKMILDSHPNEDVRARVVLELLDSDERFDTLLEQAVDRLKSDAAPSLRSRLATSLAQGFLKGKPLTFLRGEELEAWKKSRSKKVRQWLQELKDRDSSPDVRAAADEALTDLDSR